MSINSISVLIVDDADSVREGLVAAFSHQPDMHVVADANSADEAISLCREWHPDIALLDLRMNRASAVEAIMTLRAEFPASRIVGLATFPEDEEIGPALRAGAVDCLLKNMPREKMYAVIRAVYGGECPNYFHEHRSWSKIL